MLPLAGVRVLDLSRLLPGPYATLVLADLGAEVVKLEDPRGGDYLRHLPPLAGEASGAFQVLNRNKRSLALDLKARGGAAALLRLAGAFDVLVESFRPGVLERLGAGHAALRAANPRLVVCAITGYGQEGPYRELAGHDLNYAAIAGALALNGPPEAPLPFGVPPADVAGGAWVAVAGILAALHRRTATGEGGLLDVAMTDGVLGMMALPLGMAWARGAPLRRGAELLDGGAACYRTYRTRDGRFVALGALEPHFFARFCAAAGRPELAERQLDGCGRGPVEELTALFASRTREEWTRLGREQDVCLTPVLEGDEPRADPQLRARGAFGEVARSGGEGAIPVLASPVRLDGARAPFRPAPGLGADTDRVLAEAGFTPGEIAELRAGGAVGPGAPGDPTAA
ncbi:CaiB/BaiF CoA transferase family protein [Anaeromyxobacter diazotrophicus]|uniref:CoA transferase n=1 Tax=Anaeromyxobacter diazotrophicus TaxID=2590199 RepID=A0A7I9VS48_9BACT|nr:CaiB/BaiF CoA-transferase family protein [Anaeromyxobacter diazotrophicus]GEJ59266.1 CoA transferase [Anaeromyxobacter diazotrophicus]